MSPTLSFWFPLLGRLAMEAALLVALAAAAQRLITPPRVRGTLWQAVLLGVALVWLAELGGVRGPLARWWPQPREARHAVARMVGEPVSGPSEPAELGTTTEPILPGIAVEPTQPVWWPLQLWVAGMAVLIFRAVGLRCWLGWAVHCRTRVPDAALRDRVDALRQRVGLRRVRVRVWPGLGSPIAFGAVQPTIALPADFTARFSPEAQDAMLAHELAHLAARDPFWLCIADAVQALAWWHPAVWWARWQLRAASEATADEASALVPGGRVALAESLVTFGRELVVPGWTRGLGVAGDGLKSQLARRVTALLRPAGEWQAVRPVRLWLARGATLVAAVGLVALPWPGAGGPAFAEVLAASAAGVSPTPSASGNPSDVHFETASATDGPSVPGSASGETARLSYEAFRVESPSAVNGLNLSNTYRGEVGLPAGPARPLREQYQEGAPKLRAAPGVSDDGPKPAHPLYVALRPAEDPLGSPAGARTKPAEDAEWQQRYQQAKQAVREAELASDRISEKYGEDSVESRQAFDRCANARQKVHLIESVFSMDRQLEVLRRQNGEQDPKFIQTQAGRDSLLAEWEKMSRAEAGEGTLLFTRQFKGEFTEYFRRFLPLGETNLLVAVRAFCATNGVEMPAFRPGAFTSPQESKAVFYNDRTGVLFVRATAPDLSRIERGLQMLSVPAAEAEEIRAGQAKVRQASLTRLAELRLRYRDDHPKVREELASLAAVERSQRELDRNAPRLATNAMPAGASANATRQIVLETFFAEVTERGSDDLGLDWIFGQSPTNNPALQSGPATNLLTEPGSPQGQTLRVDLLRTEGQAATLTADQYTALRERLRSRSGVDFLAAPKVITLSGREAQVSVGEEKTIVTGMQEKAATATNEAGINYQTEKVTVGPKVDIIPVLEGSEIRLGIVATVTEFLGYDQPAAVPGGKPAKAVKGVEPLPRVRVRALRADSASKSGEIVALRGPLVADTVLMKDKVPVLGDIPLLGRLFRSESRSTQRKRLYVFIAPTEVTATGERVH